MVSQLLPRCLTVVTTVSKFAQCTHTLHESGYSVIVHLHETQAAVFSSKCFDERRNGAELGTKRVHVLSSHFGVDIFLAPHTYLRRLARPGFLLLAGKNSSALTATNCARIVLIVVPEMNSSREG